VREGSQEGGIGTVGGIGKKNEKTEKTRIEKRFGVKSDGKIMDVM
jgi:hypothetical protein